MSYKAQPSHTKWANGTIAIGPNLKGEIMDYEALDAWVRERLSEGEDETVYTFFREVMDRSRGFDEYRESSEAKMREYEGKFSDAEKEISRLKAHNYDLLMNGDLQADVGGGDGEVVENAVDDGEVYHIDNLFVDDKERVE